MEHCICLYKPVGITPLQLIQKFKQQYPLYAKEKLGYAGRLDPMADGLLLILVGDENKKRKIYEDLAKEYACEVLLGIATDTYDILGKIIKRTNTSVKKLQYHTSENYQTGVKQFITQYTGKQIQPYPPYSSQPVHGKPLYYWARRNLLGEIEIPTKMINIFHIEKLLQKDIAINELYKIITPKITMVSGDFRQEEILDLWNKFFKQHEKSTFPIFRFRIFCSSGTYIRSFANALGKHLQTGAIALSITRTKVGDYNLQDALKLDNL